MSGSRQLPAVPLTSFPPRSRRLFPAFSTSIAAFRPLIPITLPPGYVPAPHRNTPGIGVRAGQPSVPHVLRKDLALEDVSAREPHPPLDVGRAQHLHRRRWPPGGWCRSGRSNPRPSVPTSSRRVSQSPSRKRCGTYCANTLSVCRPVRHHALVEHGLEVELVPGARRQHPVVGGPVVRRATRPC